MRGCDLVFSPEMAEKVKDTLSELWGGTCPCGKGQRCPLLPDDLTNLMPCRITVEASAS